MNELIQAPRILGLSLYKENTDTAYYDFEKLMIYGVLQTLNFYTPVTLLDYMVPASRMMIGKHLAPQHKKRELAHLGQKLQCRYVLYGSLEPEIGPANDLDGILIQLFLFDTRLGQHLFQLQYFFSAFEENNPQISHFLPTWQGLQEFTLWLSTHIIGAVLPQRATTLWQKLQRVSLAHSIEQFQTLAQAHYIQGNEGLPQKFSLLVNLVKDQPDLFLAHLELGGLQKRMKNYSQAVAALERAYKEMKEVTARQRAQCATEIGVCYALWENMEQAFQWWKRSIQEDPSYVNPYMNLAHGLEEQGRLAEAEYYFIKASEIVPEDNRVYFNLARLYTKQEMWDKAIDQYEHQLVLEPHNAWIYGNLANCYLHKGDIARAKTYLLKTMDADPEGEAGRCANFILSGLQAADA